MNQEIKAKWLEALRSGVYPKGIGFMQCEGTFCCLGVLADLIDPTGWDEANEHHHGCNVLPTTFVLNAAGLILTETGDLVTANDRGPNRCADFSDVIPLIEAL